MFRLLRTPLRRTSVASTFSRTYTSRQTIPSLTEGEKYIFDKLTKELEPSELLVQDVSGRYLTTLPYLPGHTHQCVLLRLRYFEPPYLGGCGSFYAVTIASEKLKGLPILKQHRRIKEVLKDDMAGLHGLQVCRFPAAMAQFLTNLCAFALS